MDESSGLRRPRTYYLIAVLFIALRIPLFLDPALHLGWNSDAALFGMIAKSIAQGRGFPLFFWGQSYLGPLTSYIAAPLVWVMHPMRALRLAASLEVLAGITFYWLGLRRAFDDRVANAAALWLAIGPSYFMLFSIATIGGEPMFLLSGAIFWFAQRTGLARMRDWFILGVLAGFGWWIHQGVIFALGAAVLAKVAGRRSPPAGLHWPRSPIVRAIAIAIGADLFLGALKSLGIDAPAFFLYDPVIEPLAALIVLLVIVNGDVIRSQWDRATPGALSVRAAPFIAGAVIGYLPVIIGTLRGAVLRTYGLSVPAMPLKGVIEHAVTLLRSDSWLFIGAAASVLVMPFFIAAMIRRPRLEMPLITIVLCILFYLFSQRAHPGTMRYIVCALPMVYAFAAGEMLRVRGGAVAVIAVALLLFV